MATNKPNTSVGERGTNSPNINSSPMMTSSLSAATSVSQGKAGAVPRFLVVRRIDDGNFDKVSPFVISKCLFGLVGNLKSIKKIKDGLLVETVSEAQAKRLLRLEKLDALNVRVEPHRTLNYSKGVVACVDFLNCDVDEILKEMESEGVIGVRRIKKRVNGELVDTPSHILTFNRPKLPTNVKAAFYSLEVRPYIPNPLRCYNCQKFGHVTATCSDEKICACGKPPHIGQICQDPVKCVNCEGPHSAKSRKCPKMIEEINIQSIKTLENLSYAEARKKVCGSRGTNRMTYAQTASNMTLPQHLMPSITKAIEDQIQRVVSAAINRALSTSGTLGPITMGPPPSRSLTLEKSGSVTDASQSTQTSEKRKRPDVNYSVDDSLESDDSLTASQLSDSSKRGKKKKGWPKGKPRRPQDKSTLNEIELTQPPD